MESKNEIYYVNYVNKMAKEKIRLRRDINTIIGSIPALLLVIFGIYLFLRPVFMYLDSSAELYVLLICLLLSALEASVPILIAIVIVDKTKKRLGDAQKHMVGEFFVFHDDVMEIHFRGDFDSSKVQRVYTYNKNEITKDSSFIYEKASQFLRISSPADFVIYDDYQNGIISSDTPKDDDPDYHREGLLEFHTTTGSAENDEKLVNKIKEFAGTAYQEY